MSQENLSSALHWLPRIQAAGMPVPRTKVIPYNHDACRPCFDGQPTEHFDWLVDEIKLVDIRMPYFLRTDLASAKHNGPRAYKIESYADIGRVLYATLEDNELKFGIGGPDPAALLVREFIEFPAPFTAFDGLPIAREWRYFADGERVHKRIPYWPVGAIEQTAEYDKGLPPHWPMMLQAMYDISPPDDLEKLARRAAAACGSDVVWSVDFAQAAGERGWVLIDMALAEESWGWRAREI